MLSKSALALIVVACLTVPAQGQNYRADAVATLQGSAPTTFLFQNGGVGQTTASGAIIDDYNDLTAFAALASGTVDATAQSAFENVAVSSDIGDMGVVHTTGSGPHTLTFSIASFFSLAGTEVPQVAETFSIMGSDSATGTSSFGYFQESAALQNGVVTVSGYEQTATELNSFTSWQNAYSFTVPVVDGESIYLVETASAENAAYPISPRPSDMAMLDPSYGVVASPGTTVTTASGIPLATPVPEPSALLALGLGAAGLLRRRAWGPARSRLVRPRSL